MLTAEGKKRALEAKEFGLLNYYDEFIGNFQFSENQLFENMNKILLWLESHQDDCLISQRGYVDEDTNIDYHWFLTPQETL